MNWNEKHSPEEFCKRCLKQFTKSTVKHLSWSLFLIKLHRLDGVQLYQKETPAKTFSCKFFEIFEKTYFVEHIRADVRMKWTTKNCLIYSQESNGQENLFSAVADMWGYSFSKRYSITDALLWKLWSFTESHFYRTPLCSCFWFPVTFSIYHSFYQQ